MAATQENTVVDNTQTIGSAGGTLSAVTLDCGTNADRVAFCFVGWRVSGGQTVTGVTIGTGDDAMTALGAHQVGTWGVAVYRYIGPGTGNQEMDVTFGAGSLNNRGVVVIGVSYSGADQTTPVTGYTTTTGTDGNADITVSSQTDDLVISAAAEDDGTYTADDSGATIVAQGTNAVSAAASLGVSVRAGAASVNTQMTHSDGVNADDLVIAGFSLVPAAAAGGSSTAVLRRRR